MTRPVEAMSVSPGTLVTHGGTVCLAYPVPAASAVLLVHASGGHAVAWVPDGAMLDVIVPDPPRAPADEVEAVANFAAAGFTVGIVL